MDFETEITRTKFQTDLSRNSPPYNIFKNGHEKANVRSFISLIPVFYEIEMLLLKIRQIGQELANVRVGS